MTAPHSHDFTHDGPADDASLTSLTCRVDGCLIRADVPPNHHFYRPLLLGGPECQWVKVDELIVPVITRFWHHGVVTYASCQGGCYRLSATSPALVDPVPYESLAYVLFRAQDEHMVRRIVGAELPLPGLVWEDGTSADRKVIRWTPPGQCHMHEVERAYAESGVLLT
jgi:hypothetical protein